MREPVDNRLRRLQSGLNRARAVVWICVALAVAAYLAAAVLRR